MCILRFQFLITQINNCVYHTPGTNVTAYTLHPGCIPTDLSKNTKHLTRDQIPVFAKPPLTWLLYIFVPFLKSRTAGAQTTIYCAVSEDLEGVSGKYYRCSANLLIYLFTKKNIGDGFTGSTVLPINVHLLRYPESDILLGSKLINSIH